MFVSGCDKWSWEGLCMGINTTSGLDLVFFSGKNTTSSPGLLRENWNVAPMHDKLLADPDINQEYYTLFSPRYFTEKLLYIDTEYCY